MRYQSNKPDAEEFNRSDRLFRNSRIRRLMDLQDSKCHYCGIEMKNPTIDHVIPIKCGGGNHMNNVVAACWECNQAKGGRMILRHIPMDGDVLFITDMGDEIYRNAELERILKHWPGNAKSRPDEL